MNQNILRIKSISELHQVWNYEKPKHPLISVIDASKITINKAMLGTKVILDMYYIALKDKSCGVEYGRNYYDFEEGVLMFTSPGQAITATKTMKMNENKGWMLFFHPDLIRDSYLGRHIERYSFFDYSVYEALHLSEDEEKILNDCVGKIKHEYEQRIDRHSQRVMVSLIELLLNYCLRFYQRQFNTRSCQNKGIISQFETLLKNYFADKKQLDKSIPSINYFAGKVNFSSRYFSDLIKKETGRSAKDHINDYIIELAKDSLMETNQTISEIAYSLGFNYPHYFTRMFKKNVGMSPLEYRQLN